MPIYEYECLPNKHRFEVIQKFNDPPVTHCTVCGEPVQRLLSPPAIHFKGTGWYITDYSRKQESKSSDTSPKKEESKPAAASDSKKTESKSSDDSK